HQLGGHHPDRQQRVAFPDAPGHRGSPARPEDLRARLGDGGDGPLDALPRRADRDARLLVAVPPDPLDVRPRRALRDPFRHLLALRHVPRRHPALRGAAAPVPRQRPEEAAAGPLAAADPRAHDLCGPADRARGPILRAGASEAERGGQSRMTKRRFPTAALLAALALGGLALSVAPPPQPEYSIQAIRYATIPGFPVSALV